jgi:Transposase
MLYAGLDLSRARLEFHLLDAEGATVEVGATPPDADGLRGLSERLARHGDAIRAAIESMNGARFVHDRLELHGWRVEIADAQKVKGLAPLACKTDRIDAWVLAELARRELVPAIWLPDPLVRAERERARWRLHLVRHRSSLKQRVHAVLVTHGKPCPVSDLFGLRGRQMLARLGLPEPWQGTIEASLRLIDELDREIGDCERELRRLGADHRYAPCSAPCQGSAGCSPTRSPPNSATSAASPHHASSPATRASAPASTNQANATCAARSPNKAPATCAGRSSRPPPTPARRPSIATATSTPRPASASNAAPGRPARPRPPTRRSDLAHAHPQRTLRSGRRHRPPGRLTVPKEMRHRSELQSAMSSPPRRR